MIEWTMNKWTINACNDRWIEIENVDINQRIFFVVSSRIEPVFRCSGSGAKFHFVALNQYEILLLRWAQRTENLFFCDVIDSRMRNVNIIRHKMIIKMSYSADLNHWYQIFQWKTMKLLSFNYSKTSFCNSELRKGMKRSWTISKSLSTFIKWKELSI